MQSNGGRTDRAAVRAGPENGSEGARPRAGAREARWVGPSQVDALGCPPGARGFWPPVAMLRVAFPWALLERILPR